jgi:hypothetical protein
MVNVRAFGRVADGFEDIVLIRAFGRVEEGVRDGMSIGFLDRVAEGLLRLVDEFTRRRLVMHDDAGGIGIMDFRPEDIVTVRFEPIMLLRERGLMLLTDDVLMIDDGPVRIVLCGLIDSMNAALLDGVLLRDDWLVELRGIDAVTHHRPDDIMLAAFFCQVVDGLTGRVPE